MVILITGGSGSGKSEYAENRTTGLAEAVGGRRLYIATMEPYDEESHKRIARHRQMRQDKQFTTVECYTHLEKLEFEKTDTVLLECVSNLTANEMYGKTGRKEHVSKVIFEGIKRMAECAANVIIVGNNVFEDGMEYDASTTEYIEQMATVQNQIAAMADEVVEVVCGIPIIQKGMNSI